MCSRSNFLTSLKNFSGVGVCLQRDWRIQKFYREAEVKAGRVVEWALANDWSKNHRQ
jgi:hypothetical protein